MTNQEAINILKDMIDYQWGFSDMEKSIGIDALRIAIEALERRKAHWNFTLNADRDSWIVKCSCCGYERLEILDTRYGLKKIKIMYIGTLKQDKYCLNCGAKIEGE